MNDMRHAFRVLRKDPVFTAVTLIIIALGIGDNTVMFSLMDAWLIRPLRFKNPAPAVCRLCVVRCVIIFCSGLATLCSA